jgi:carbonic anhydrase
MVRESHGPIRSLSLKFLLAAALLASCTAFGASDAPSISPQKALDILKAGNRRFMSSKLAHPRQNMNRVQSVSKAQHPVAIVLGCSDSRVPPEVVFDQGIGDLFIIRVAGNIADNAVLGSIEYAADHLGTPLIVVLGHERCGAVTAAVQGGTPPGHIGALTRAIAPAVFAAKKMKGDVVENAIKVNVRNVVKQLEADHPLLSEKVKKGTLKVVGARYDLDTGAVAFFP